VSHSFIDSRLRAARSAAEHALADRRASRQARQELRFDPENADSEAVVCACDVTAFNDVVEIPQLDVETK